MSSSFLPELLRDYISKMLTATHGMKTLILDKDTTPAVSMVYTQMEILNKEVVLVSQLDELSEKTTGSNAHLKAVCFVRPTAENVRLLSRQLKTSHGFAEYHVYFMNAVRDGFLQELADADEHERVRVVQELFCDYLILDQHLFTVPVMYRSALMRPVVSDRSRAVQNADRIVEGVASLLLTLKRRAVIRYSANSDTAKLVADNLWHLMYQQERALFDYRGERATRWYSSWTGAMTQSRRCSRNGRIRRWCMSSSGSKTTG